MLIFLIGYMGSGKSTLASLMADRICHRFMDMDSLFESQSGYSVDEFFDLFGEEAFREKERDLLHILMAGKEAVISTGGGTPCFYDNMDRMNDAGITVYLRLSPSLLWRRLLGNAHQRPLLKNVDAAGLMQYITRHLLEREEFYLKSRIIMDAGDLKAESIVEKIIAEVDKLNY